SGRGMWLFWLLRDQTSPNQAHCGAWRDNPLDHALLYSEIQHRLSRALSGIGFDPAGTDTARHVRIDGSLHTKADNYVRWWLQGGGHSGYTYTLKGLADLLGINRAAAPVRHVPGERNRQAYHVTGHKAAG